MFEGILEKVLQQKLGQYLEGFDKQNLSIGIWSGNILLENMRIRSNICQQFGLPLKLIFGKIKKLHIRVPWTKLQSAPVELVLESLMLVVSPTDKNDWQAKEMWSFEHKKKLLDEITSILVVKMRLSMQGSGQKDKSKEDEGFVDKIATKIIDNIQITIKNIHIRYEVDLMQKQGNHESRLQYAVGLTLQELGINTTNHEWKKTFFDRTVKENREKPIYKRLAIQGLAMYMSYDPFSEFSKGKIKKMKLIDKEFLSQQFEFPEEFKEEPEAQQQSNFTLLKEKSEKSIERQMQIMFPPGCLYVQGMPYIIQPIFLELNLTQLIKVELDKPLFRFDVKLDELNLSLTKRQYEIIFSLADYFKQYGKFIERFNQKKKFKHLRPVYPIKFVSSSQNFKPISFQSKQEKEDEKSNSESSSNLNEKSNDENEDQFYDAASEYREQSAKSSSDLQNFNEKACNFSRDWWKFAIKSVIKDLKFKRGGWNEFKLTSWRKKEYAKHFTKVVQKSLTPDHSQILDTKLPIEDQYLLRHIVEASEISDLQNWLGIVIKRRLQKEQAIEQSKKEKKQAEGGGFFSSFFNSKKAPPSKSQQEEKINDPEEKLKSQDEEITFTEEEIEQIQGTLRQMLAESSIEDVKKDLGYFTEEEKSRQVTISANLIFKRGRINLVEDFHTVELYQDDLSVIFNFKRDTSFSVSIANRNVGLNVHEKQGDKFIVQELVVKAVDKQEDSKIDSEILQWRLEIEKKGSLDQGFMTDIFFESNPIKVKYDAKALSKVTSFFQTGASEEIRDQAYNKISAIKDSTQTSLKDLLYKKSNNLTVRIASPILELPFKAHNSEMLGEQESERDRIWLVNLGNLDFKTYNQSNDQNCLDEYERFKLLIDQIGLKYIKRGQEFKVLEEVEIILDIGIKNKIKAALIDGQNKSLEANSDLKNIAKLSPEVIVNAQLPAIVVNFSPDVYNGLVNINQVLSSQGQSEHLQQLKLEKDQIIDNSYYHHEEVFTKGLKGSLSSNWHGYFLLVSGSYIYFYKTRKDLMPHHYIYIGDCQISSQVEQLDLVTMIGKQQDLKNALLVRQRNGDILYLKFDDLRDSQEFIQVIVKAQLELSGGEVNILRKQDVLSDLIHKDQREVGFVLTIEVQLAEVKVWQSTEKAIEDQKRGTLDQMWLNGVIKDLKFSLLIFQYEVKLRFSLESLKIAETLKIKEDMLLNEGGQNICEIDIDVYDIYSPNIQDSEIIVTVRLGKVYLLFDPTMINQTLIFFRNTRSFDVKDIEGLNVRLMNDSETYLDRFLAARRQDHSEDSGYQSFASSRRQSMRHETCKTIDLILVKTLVKANGLTLIALHNIYYTPVFELTVGETEFGYDMFYDHDVLRGKFANAKAYDLTNYPETFDPSKTKKASLKDLHLYTRYEIIGIRDCNKEGNAANAIYFESILYTDKCPLHPPNITSSLTVEVASVKIVYFYEMSFRVIDYFMDKFLWSITETDPYPSLDAFGNKIKEQLDLKEMSEMEIENINMKQEKNTMQMIFKIHRPYLILKDKPLLQSNLELDFGEMIVTYDEVDEIGRFLRAPRKSLIVSKFILQCSDLGIKFRIREDAEEYFEVAPSFNLNLAFSYISHSELLPMICSHQLNKAFKVDISFEPELHLVLRQDIYTYILRCIDLNFAYTDYLEDRFNFRNEEEYFRSTDYLLKSRTIIKVDFLALSLLTNEGENLTELGLKKPIITIDYHLNRRHNYDITVEEMSSFFMQGLDQQLLLFGNLNQIHCIETYEDLKDCICSTDFNFPSKIKINISMYPDGNKYFNVDISNLKLFLHPYSFLMIDHFFREGMPLYDNNSKDKPNEYSEDVEDLTEMNLVFKLSDSLICFADLDIGNQSSPSSFGIACQSSMEYQFQREKIKSIKAQLWEKVSQISSLAENADKPIQLPTSWMRLTLKQLSPYICDLSELELSNFSEIKKRQIIQPFDSMFHFAKFLLFRQKEQRLFCYDKSEIKGEKVIVKVSFKDFQLMQTIWQQFSSGYQKYNEFYLGFMKQKKNNVISKQAESIRQNKDERKSFLQKTQQALNMLRSMSISGASSSKNSQINQPVGNQSQFMIGGNNQMYQEVPKTNAELRQDFISQKIDYESAADICLTKMISQGVQIVVINDSNNIFYPILTANLSNFEYKSIGEFGHFNGKCLFKAMISYYNSSASEWEPFIEKTKIELMTNFYKGQIFNLISFKNNLNINVTTSFLQTMLQTRLQMSKKQQQSGENQSSLMSQVNRISAVTSRQSNRMMGTSSRESLRIRQRLAIGQKQDSKGAMTRSQVEYKVTPYSIVNYSSRVITVRSVFYMNGDDRLKEYVIQPGQKVDYEVDYEDEIQHLMRETNEEVVKKQDFLNVAFEGNAYSIKDINLRNPNFYHHVLQERCPQDYVCYGVKVEDMRRVLIIRAPYVINNLTDNTYKLRLLKPDSKSILKVVTLEPGQCYPIDLKEQEYKFQLSYDQTVDQWSSPIKFNTIIEKVPKNATTYLYHGNQFTIITKEKSEYHKNYNINFKTPVIIRNALPCNFKIRTDVILGKLTANQMPYKSAEDENFEYEQKEFMIERGQSLKLHNYNLKNKVDFLFTLDNQVSHQNQTRDIRESVSTTSKEMSIKHPCYQWGEFVAVNQEFKIEKKFLIKDSDNQECPPLEVYAKMKKCKEAGVHITFFVKNVIVNNTDKKLFVYYSGQKLLPAAGQFSSFDNSIIMLSDRAKIVACIEDFDLHKVYSSPFNIDVAAVSNTIQIKQKDQNAFHEFTVKTELSRACDDDEDDIYTKVTTISPCYVLHNKTSKTLLITQEDCLDQCQILLSGMRIPFFWKDSRRPRLVKIKCVEKDGAEYDDDSHDWTYSFSLNEIGRMNILNRHKRQYNRSKHLLVEKQLQEENQILYVTFNEETSQFATYKIENHSKHIHIEYHQKDYPNYPGILLPEQNQIFSWTNPHNAEYKITCKFFGSQSTGLTAQQEASIDIEPDNLELNERFILPQHLQNGKKNRVLCIYTITNGFSKILVFSDVSQESQLRKKYQQMDEELKEGDLIVTKTLKVEIMSIGLSLICQTFQEKRKEFAFAYVEDLKFIHLEADKKREVQLRIGYAQIDNNISAKPMFQVIMFPKELFMKRDKALQSKKASQPSSEEASLEIKEFFNMHITTRLDDPQVLFFEEIDFLVQTIVLQMDDEFIGYIYRFTDSLNTNITSMHDIFRQKISNNIDEDLLEMENLFSHQNQDALIDQQQQRPRSFGILMNQQHQSQYQINTLAIEEEEEEEEEEKESVTSQPQEKGKQSSSPKKENTIGSKLNFFQQTLRQGGWRASSHIQSEQSERQTSITAQSLRDCNQASMNAFSQQHSQSWLNYNIENKSKKLYIKDYKSSPLDIELSYVTKIKTDLDQQANKRFSLGDKVRNYGLTLVNVDGAQVRINSLVLSNIFGTPNDIVFQLKSHYISRLKKNLFNVIGSSNILGDPANFVSHLGTGVQDFFYMPINGIVKGPLEGGKGILKGTSSLIKNTVQGTFGSASKVLSSMSKGLLLITSDGEFINKREQSNLERPKNVIEGVGYGLKSTFKGIASGITGVVENPIKGAQREGVKGFMKGTYKGLSGLVVKPISGALDFFSKTSEGIKNTAGGPKDKKVKRIRMIRPFYGRLQLIRGYNEFHAEVLHELVKVEKGRYSQLNFLDALLYNELSERKQKVIILTEEYFLIMDPAHRDIAKLYPSKDVMTISNQDNALVVYVVNEKDDLVEGFKMKLDTEKVLNRNFKILQNYIYHVRTEMVHRNNERKAITKQ